MLDEVFYHHSHDCNIQSLFIVLSLPTWIPNLGLLSNVPLSTIPVDTISNLLLFRPILSYPTNVFASEILFYGFI